MPANKDKDTRFLLPDTETVRVKLYASSGSASFRVEVDEAELVFLQRLKELSFEAGDGSEKPRLTFKVIDEKA